MRRSLTTAGVAVVAGAAIAASSGAAITAGPIEPPAKKAAARLISCTQARQAIDRAALYQGVMRSLRGGHDRMDMRFDVQTRALGATKWLPLHGSGLGVWIRAEAGVMLYRFRKRVANLPAPASYRATVRFRWLNAAGVVIARTKRITKACVQHVGLPDLRIGAVTVQPLSNPARLRYLVTVRNAGDARAGIFAASLTVNGVRSTQPAVGPIPAGGRRVASFDAVKCTPGSDITVVLDTEDSVLESDEANDTATVACPA
jgi:hypothetical protein